MCQVSKPSVLHKTSSKCEPGGLIRANTPRSRARSKQFCNPNPSEQSLLTCQSRGHSNKRLYQTSRAHNRQCKVPSRTSSCLQHTENTSTAAGPRQVTMSYYVIVSAAHCLEMSCNICTPPHVWNDFGTSLLHPHPSKTRHQNTASRKAQRVNPTGTESLNTSKRPIPIPIPADETHVNHPWAVMSLCYAFGQIVGRGVTKEGHID